MVKINIPEHTFKTLPEKIILIKSTKSTKQTQTLGSTLTECDITASLQGNIKAQDSLVLWPDGTVVVQEVGEMVGHQVLAGHTQVDWVPRAELQPQSLQLLAWDVCGRRETNRAKHVVPYLCRQLLRPGDGDNNNRV